MLVPGLFLVVFPAWLMRTDPALFSPGMLHWLAINLIPAGAIGTLWCACAFTAHGDETPSPTDLPKKLVFTGLYSIIRNPIYRGVLLMMLGYVLWHPTRFVPWILVIVTVSSLLFDIFFEEPHLHKTFGAAYKEYYKSVPRRLPTLRTRK